MTWTYLHLLHHTLMAWIKFNIFNNHESPLKKTRHLGHAAQRTPQKVRQETTPSFRQQTHQDHQSSTTPSVQASPLHWTSLSSQTQSIAPHSLGLSTLFNWTNNFWQPARIREVQLQSRDKKDNHPQAFWRCGQIYIVTEESSVQRRNSQKSGKNLSIRSTQIISRNLATPLGIMITTIVIMLSNINPIRLRLPLPAKSLNIKQTALTLIFGLKNFQHLPF